MAKVEMSLNEYNELRDELLFLRELVKDLTTANVDEYYYQKLTDGTYDCMSVSSDSDLRDAQKKYLLDSVMENLPDKLKELLARDEYEISDTYNLYRMSLFNISRVYEGENSEEV